MAPRSQRAWAKPLFHGVLLVVLSVGALYAVSPDFRALFDRTVTPSCTVGLNGAAVSVTVQGPSAQAQCDSLLRTVTDGGTWYQYSGGQQPAGASICQIHYLGDLWTVRDSGALDLYGTGICTNLTNLANGVPLVTPVPAPTIRVPPRQVYAVCGLRVAGHDATVLMDVDECAAFERDYPPADGSWKIYTGSAAPAGDELVCQGGWKGDGTSWGQAQIWDSGGQYYATDLCNRLGWTP